MNGVRAMTWLARACAAAALAIVAAGALRWIALRPWFDLARIEVRGELTHVSRASVRAALAGRMRGNFFTVSLDDVRRAFESVPWVAAASVRRAWPDRLVVTLREHRALGLWSDGRLLADSGRLFVANLAEAEIHGPLPQFDGPEAFASEATRRFYEFAAGLAPLALTINGIEISERASWALTTDAGQRFELGRDEPPGRLSERLAQLGAAYPHVAARFGGAPGRIDLRYANGLAAAPAKQTRASGRT
jgi:cell division protein FtsQ